MEKGCGRGGEVGGGLGRPERKKKGWEKVAFQAEREREREAGGEERG